MGGDQPKGILGRLVQVVGASFRAVCGVAGSGKRTWLDLKSEGIYNEKVAHSDGQ
jgi:hypothetical protein